MKKIIFALFPWLLALTGYKAMAQETPKIAGEEKKEVQEIIIKKNGDKDATVTLQFKDGKVTVNGKPLVEFKDDAITVYKNKIIIRDMKDRLAALGDMEHKFRDFEFNMDGNGMKWEVGPGQTFLGVVTEKHTDGALIKDITKGSAAEKAGLKEGDIITKVDGKKVDGPEELASIIGAMKPKDVAKISFKRDGKERSEKATLQERKNSMARSYSFTTPDGKSKSFSMPPAPRTPGAMSPRVFEFNGDGYYDNLFTGRPKLGLKIQDLEEGAGVKVLEVEEGSAAQKAGMQKDDIITAIGDAKVNNTDMAREQLAINGNKSGYSITAKRNNKEMKFDIKIPKKLKTANL
jgi:serine protease Do